MGGASGADLEDGRVPDTLRRLRDGAVGEFVPRPASDYGLPDPPRGHSYMLDSDYLRREAEVRGQLMSRILPDGPLPGAPRRPAPRSLQPYWSDVVGWAVLGLFLYVISSCTPLSGFIFEPHITTEGSKHESATGRPSE